MHGRLHLAALIDLEWELGCDARYQSGIYGCQFQISANTSGRLFASTNAYKGTGSGSSQRPACEILYEDPISGGYEARFRMP